MPETDFQMKCAAFITKYNFLIISLPDTVIMTEKILCINFDNFALIIICTHTKPFAIVFVDLLAVFCLRRKKIDK
jgi:hypothetical protein